MNTLYLEPNESFSSPLGWIQDASAPEGWAGGGAWTLFVDGHEIHCREDSPEDMQVFGHPEVGLPDGRYEACREGGPPRRFRIRGGRFEEWSEPAWLTRFERVVGVLDVSRQWVPEERATDGAPGPCE